MSPGIDVYRLRETLKSEADLVLALHRLRRLGLS